MSCGNLKYVPNQSAVDKPYFEETCEVTKKFSTLPSRRTLTTIPKESANLSLNHTAKTRSSTTNKIMKEMMIKMNNSNNQKKKKK